MKIFVYGSLMNTESCERTLKRRVDYQEARLPGFIRTYDATGAVHSDYLNQVVKTNFANIKKVSNCEFSSNENNMCYGLTFDITQAELIYLKQREYFYSLIDITSLIKFQEEDTSEVYTFIYEGLSSHVDSLIFNEKDKVPYILKRYLEIILEGVQEFKNVHNQVISEIENLSKELILNGGFRSVSGAY